MTLYQPDNGTDTTSPTWDPFDEGRIRSLWTSGNVAASLHLLAHHECPNLHVTNSERKKIANAHNDIAVLLDAIQLLRDAYQDLDDQLGAVMSRNRRLEGAADRAQRWANSCSALSYYLRIYIHAHKTGNSVPPGLEAAAEGLIETIGAPVTRERRGR